MIREAGFGTAAWMIGMAMVVVPLAVIALSLPRWYDRAEVGRALAQEIARTVVRAVDLEAGLAVAELATAEAAEAAGLSTDPACSESCISYQVEGALERGQQITATVHVDLPGIFVPFVGTVQGGAWGAVHTERVDDFRSFP